MAYAKKGKICLKLLKKCFLSLQNYLRQNGFSWASKYRHLILNLSIITTLIITNIFTHLFINTILVIFGIWLIRRNPMKAHFYRLWMCYIVSSLSIILLSFLPWWCCTVVGIMFAMALESKFGLKIIISINKIICPERFIENGTKKIE